MYNKRVLLGKGMLLFPVFVKNNFRKFSQIFAKIRKFSQTFANFRKLSQIFANFRKNSQTFAKVSQKLARFSNKVTFS